MPTLNANNALINFAETGGGTPVVVLVHGAGGSHATWTRQLEGLAETARVIALDLPGHGRSSGEGCPVVAEYAASVRAFIRGLNAGPVILGGHSMGGAVTLTIALEAPELLRGVLLVGTGARLRVFPRLFELMDKDYGEAVDFIQGYGWSPAAAPALLAGGRVAMLETRPAVTRADFTGCNRFDLMARINEIRQPALVIVGDDDQLTPPKYSEYMAKQIPGARLVRIPRAGHYVPLEQPDQVNAAIRSFLRWQRLT